MNTFPSLGLTVGRSSFAQDNEGNCSCHVIMITMAVIHRRLHFTAHIPVLWLLHFFCSLFHDVPWGSHYEFLVPDVWYYLENYGIFNKYSQVVGSTSVVAGFDGDFYP